jgi:hypothetical protein
MELVEACPPIAFGSMTSVRSPSDVGHGHSRTTAEIVELDEDFGGRGVSFGQAHRGGREKVAVLVGHRLGIDQALVLDDLAIYAGELFSG